MSKRIASIGYIRAKVVTARWPDATRSQVDRDRAAAERELSATPTQVDRVVLRSSRLASNVASA
jgi:hypothetical protein